MLHLHNVIYKIYRKEKPERKAFYERKRYRALPRSAYHAEHVQRMHTSYFKIPKAAAEAKSVWTNVGGRKTCVNICMY